MALMDCNGFCCFFLTEYPKEERSRNVKQMLREKLPIENYELFKYLIEFLVKVSDRLMTKICFFGDILLGNLQVHILKMTVGESLK